MIDWIFILIALHGTSATADSVGFESESVCTAYARGALSRPEIQHADIQAAQCVSLRTGRHIDFRPPVPIVTPSSDPFSFLAMAIPMLVFYEGSILLGRLLHK